MAVSDSDMLWGGQVPGTLKKTLSDCLLEVSKDNSLEGSEIEKREDQVGAPWSSKQGLSSLLLVKDITTAYLSA